MEGDNSLDQPTALKHGVTSRWLFQAMADELEELTAVLVGSSPPLPSILEAARRAADAVLRLSYIRSMKTFVLNSAEPVRELDIRSTAMRRAFASKGGLWGTRGRKILNDVGGKGRAGDRSDLELLKVLEGSDRLLERLDQYERRVLSQRKKAIRELDLARIDAERQGSGVSP